MNSTNNIIPITIEKEMKTSYLDYAMSVIVSRAIPDVRDGLKPVHRRIIYAMDEAGCSFNRPYRKSARIVGDVMGKYHPHGDAAIYDSLVRMAQNFSLRLPLVDGQGNFGSMDGDSPAAMRYTESRMEKVAHCLVRDIDKDTVDFGENYDGSAKEPVVLPAEFPNLLVNGSGGIAVGMATNIAPHNLGEVIDACCAMIDNPETTDDELLEIVPAPDFPTGGIILGRKGATSAMMTGRGSVVIRGRAEIETNAQGRETIIVSEIPYQVNKASMVEKIAALVKEKRIEGISDLRDESDKSGVRVVVEVKRDADANVILSQLYKYTPLQTSFGVNMLALSDGKPQTMNLRQVLSAFLKFRDEVVTRRTQFLLRKARERAHILIGLSLAVANIDEVIAIIRGARDPAQAKEELMSRKWQAEVAAPLIALVDDAGNEIDADGRCFFTEEQAKAILEMRLSRLTGLEQARIDEELQELAAEITRHLELLGSEDVKWTLIRSELVKIRDEFATPRRSTIEASEFEEDIEDLIQREDMVVTVTMGGYIKRVPLATYRAQRRGGKGRSAMAVREEDITTQVFVANTHTPMLFFSTKGKVYYLKVYRLPLGGANTRGRSLMNIFPLEEGETINQVLALPEDEALWESEQIMFATASGNVRRNLLSDFQNIRANGKIAMKLEEGDSLIGVGICNESQHILLAANGGKAVRFCANDVRVFKGRGSTGVRGMRLEEGDRVISMTVLRGGEMETETREQYLKIPAQVRMDIAQAVTAEEELTPELRAHLDECEIEDAQLRQYIEDEEFLITITENGYGKRSSAYEYRTTSRGTKGIVNIVTSERNGNVVASLPVNDADEVMLMTGAGKLIRCGVHDVRITGRNTQGVTLFKVNGQEHVSSVAHIPSSQNEDDVEPDEDMDVDGEE